MPRAQKADTATAQAAPARAKVATKTTAKAILGAKKAVPAADDAPKTGRKTADRRRRGTAARREDEPTGRRGPVRYRQVADMLRDRIVSGVLPAGSPLPSESQLVAEFGVSTNTARAAIAVLRSEGLVITLHGKGSIIRRADDRPALTYRRTVTTADPDTSGTAGGLAYVDAATDERCWAPVEEPVIYRVDATPDLALALGLPEHAPVFGVDRLLADPAGRRLFHRLYVPVAVAADVPALEADPFRTPADLYTVLAQAGHEPAWTETVRARMPSPDDAGALRIPAGTPMLVTRRATTGRHGRILALEETRLSAEDTQLAYRITGD